MSEKTFSASDVRRIVAHQSVEDYAGGYLNSLIGGTAAETCRRVEALMPFLLKAIDKSSDDDWSDWQPAISFLAQSIWTAMQHEMEIADAEGLAGEVAADD